MYTQLEDLNVYAPLWKKYRPVILKLMVESENKAQEYQLFVHEFKALSPKEKSFTFQVEASNERPKYSKKSKVAMGLMEVLVQSKTASDLLENEIFEISLDKNFKLQVNRKRSEEAMLAEG